MIEGPDTFFVKFGNFQSIFCCIFAFYAKFWLDLVTFTSESPHCSHKKCSNFDDKCCKIAKKYPNFLRKPCGTPNHTVQYFLPLKKTSKKLLFYGPCKFFSSNVRGSPLAILDFPGKKCKTDVFRHSC